MHADTAGGAGHGLQQGQAEAPGSKTLAAAGVMLTAVHDALVMQVLHAASHIQQAHIDVYLQGAERRRLIPGHGCNKECVK